MFAFQQSNKAQYYVIPINAAPYCCDVYIHTAHTHTQHVRWLDTEVVFTWEEGDDKIGSTFTRGPTQIVSL